MEVGAIILLGLLGSAVLTTGYALWMMIRFGYSVRKGLKELNK